MNVGMNEVQFDRRDPILVFDFLSWFVTEAGTLEVNEAQAFVALPHFLSGFCLKQHRAICG